jgi:hypothetical protein
VVKKRFRWGGALGVACALSAVPVRAATWSVSTVAASGAATSATAAESAESAESAMSLDASLIAPEQNPTVRVLWSPLTREGSLLVLLKELRKPLGTLQPVAQRRDVPRVSEGGINPLGMADGDFRTGMNLVYPTQKREDAPLNIEPADARFFEDLVATGNLPDVFIIGGHHVIGEGYHDDAEKNFIYTPSLIRGIDTYPAMKQVFGNVKVGILWGCNTLTNLEPHGPNGEYLDPQQIEEMYENPETRDDVLGRKVTPSAYAYNSWNMYVNRLRVVYGPNSSVAYEYTTEQARERCEGTPAEPYRNCHVTNLMRVLPHRALFDGEHRMNGAAVHKRIFPNARVLLGFAGTSPSEETRAAIFQAALNRAYQLVNQGVQPGEPAYVSNILGTIVSDERSEHFEQLRLRAIKALRSAWATTSYRMNIDPDASAPVRNRPGASITPAYPELDANGMFVPETRHEMDGKTWVFPAVKAYRTPQYRPYERRSNLN